MMKFICWLEGIVKIHKEEEYEVKNEAHEILKWNMWYKFFFSIYCDKYDYECMNPEDQQYHI
jgi:hypothetical protein